MRGFGRFAIIFALNTVEYSSIALTYAAVPVVLRANGAPLEFVGLFSLLIFAFVFSLAWAPFVDRYRLSRFGRRRSWIIVTQIVTAGLLALLALVEPRPENIILLFVMCAAVSAVAATQRVALLGFMAESLDPEQRPFGATAGGIGAAVGHLVGGAGGLFLIEQFGWISALFVFAVGVALAGVVVVFIEEPEKPSKVPSTAVAWSLLRSLKTWSVLLLLAPASIGIASAFAMAEPRLVDVGYGLTQVGLIAGMANLFAFATIGPLVSLYVRNQSPARGLSLICVISAFTFALAIGIGSINANWGALASITAIFASFSAVHVCVTALFISLAEGDSAGTHLTALVAGQSLLAMPGFIASGFLASAMGHQAPVAVAAVGTLLTAVLVFQLGHFMERAERSLGQAANMAGMR